MTTTCPCGSAVEFKACCQPILDGKKPASTAEELLRARYTAFTRANVDFVISTHHSSTVHEVKREEISDWATNSTWLGMEVVQKEAGGPNDSKGTIVFWAKYQDKKKPAAKVEEHWEQAVFEKENGAWKFLDAKGIQRGPIRRTEPKIGRNDPCPCGSGKKHKKCCGQ
jgi:SEC-C motif-containing protein